MSEQGAAGVVLLALVTVAMAAAVVLADVGVLIGARLRAAAAADAAALAAAPVTFAPFGTEGGPTDAAAAVAAANGAGLVVCRCPVDRSWSLRRVEVVAGVTVDLLTIGQVQVHASSRAEFEPRDLIGGLASSLAGHPAETCGQQAGGAGLVERLVEVAALRRLHA